MRRDDNKGFTLAELLIVVAIIGVLVAISIPIFTAQLKKASVASQSYIELSDAKIERSRQCYYVSACT